jgi:hypothetical protein
MATDTEDERIAAMVRTWKANQIAEFGRMYERQRQAIEERAERLARIIKTGETRR